MSLTLLQAAMLWLCWPFVFICLMIRHSVWFLEKYSHYKRAKQYEVQIGIWFINSAKGFLTLVSITKSKNCITSFRFPNILRWCSIPIKMRTKLEKFYTVIMCSFFFIKVCFGTWQGHMKGYHRVITSVLISIFWRALI